MKVNFKKIILLGLLLLILYILFKINNTTENFGQRESESTNDKGIKWEYYIDNEWIDLDASTTAKPTNQETEVGFIKKKDDNKTLIKKFWKDTADSRTALNKNTIEEKGEGAVSFIFTTKDGIETYTVDNDIKTKFYEVLDRLNNNNDICIGGYLNHDANKCYRCDDNQIIQNKECKTCDDGKMGSFDKTTCEDKLELSIYLKYKFSLEETTKDEYKKLIIGKLKNLLNIEEEYIKNNINITKNVDNNEISDVSIKNITLTESHKTLLYTIPSDMFNFTKNNEVIKVIINQTSPKINVITTTTPTPTTTSSSTTSNRNIKSKTFILYLVCETNCESLKDADSFNIDTIKNNFKIYLNKLKLTDNIYNEDQLDLTIEPLDNFKILKASVTYTAEMANIYKFRSLIYQRFTDTTHLKLLRSSKNEFEYDVDFVLKKDFDENTLINNQEENSNSTTLGPDSIEVSDPELEPAHGKLHTFDQSLCEEAKDSKCYALDGQWCTDPDFSITDKGKWMCANCPVCRSVGGTAPGPSTIEPSTTEPSTTGPSTTGPSTIESATTEPSTTEPATAEPATTEPATAKSIVPGVENNIPKDTTRFLKEILEHLKRLNPEKLSTDGFNEMSNKFNFLDSFDLSKLLGVLISTLRINLDELNLEPVKNLLSYISKLVYSKSNINKYNINEDIILSSEIKRSIQHNTLKRLSEYDKDLLLSTSDSELWRQIIFLNEKYINKNPYATPYVPGYSYIPPQSWETRRKKVPVCVNDNKKVAAPAFVFGSGVPSNALEIEGTGSGQVGSMLPKFSYREEESGVWTDNEMYNSDNIDKIVYKHQKEYLDSQKKLQNKKISMNGLVTVSPQTNKESVLNNTILGLKQNNINKFLKKHEENHEDDSFDYNNVKNPLNTRLYNNKEPNTNSIFGMKQNNVNKFLKKHEENHTDDNFEYNNKIKQIPTTAPTTTAPTTTAPTTTAPTTTAPTTTQKIKQCQFWYEKNKVLFNSETQAFRTCAYTCKDDKWRKGCLGFQIDHFSVGSLTKYKCSRYFDKDFVNVSKNTKRELVSLDNTLKVFSKNPDKTTFTSKSLNEFCDLNNNN